ncbi:unnamed protein product [Lathyrus sativus]|nr:unnamed protein product [Lathyrus sativus]
MNKMSYFSYFLVVFVLCVSSSYAAKEVDVDTICKEVSNSTYCSALLNSKSGESRDLISFAEYAIEAARVNVTNTLELIKNLIANSGSNVEAKRHYEMCLYHFDEEYALGLVNEALDYVKSGAYESARQNAWAIQSHATDCVSGESPGETPYPDPSQLPNYAQLVTQTSEIFAHIVKFITQP